MRRECVNKGLECQYRGKDRKYLREDRSIVEVFICNRTPCQREIELQIEMIKCLIKNMGCMNKAIQEVLSEAKTGC
jgi:hypothetical protein